MLILDDILLAPLRGVTWLAREIHGMVEQAISDEATALHQSLRELYMMVETDQITEAEFEERERELLDRLEAAAERQARLD